MSGYKVVALSAKGEQALKDQVVQWNKINFRDKVMFEKFLKRSVESEKPFVIRIDFKSALLGLSNVHMFINATMLEFSKEGVVENVDLKYEVIS